MDQPTIDLLKMLGTAVGAIWSFYGATQLALLGFIVLPKDGRLNTNIDHRLLLTCLGLFFAVNLSATAMLQGFAIDLMPSASRPHGVENASQFLLLLHLALDVAAFCLVVDALKRAEARDSDDDDRFYNRRVSMR